MEQLDNGSTSARLTTHSGQHVDVLQWFNSTTTTTTPTGLMEDEMTNKITVSQKAQIRAYLLDYYSDRDGRDVRFAADGSVSIHVDPMPNTNQAGRIFAGWASELINQ